MAIEAVPTEPAGPHTSGRRSRAARRSRGGPDPLSIALFSLALFMVLLALLAHQLAAAPGKTAHYTLVRKIYRTRVIETIIGPGPSSVSQSVASSGSLSAAPAVSTRTS